jgi:hypothetical protein
MDVKYVIVCVSNMCKARPSIAPFLCVRMCDIIRIHFKAIQGAKKGLIETWRQGQKDRAKIGL